MFQIVFNVALRGFIWNLQISVEVLFVIPSLPYDLMRLYSSLDEESTKFRKSIRTHNNSLAFTSLVVFYDIKKELSKRFDALPELHESTIKLLMSVLGQNPYAKFFKSLRDIPNLENQTIILNSNPSLDQRLYSLPYSSQDSKVQGIIFNQVIPIMGPKRQVYKKYLISNAEVRLIPETFMYDGIDIQWVISNETVVEELPDEESDMVRTKFVYTKYQDFLQYTDSTTQKLVIH
ncbi:hypothetical protein ACH5RR_012085 [Cinchona calisaya]|uniref:Uncharacterized protein n=1 Tax=Cinchona calisaya TaxID=153742 RepID=A0ABD3A6S0_9GENT